MKLDPVALLDLGLAVTQVPQIGLLFAQPHILKRGRVYLKDVCAHAANISVRMWLSRAIRS